MGLEGVKPASLILDEEVIMHPKVQAEYVLTETEVAPTQRNESEFASNRPHDVAHADLSPVMPPHLDHQKNQPTAIGPHTVGNGSAVTPSVAPMDTRESDSLPFGISQTSWELMPPSLRLQIWLSRSMQNSDNSQMQYNDLHTRHILRKITAGIDTNKKIPCPRCGNPGDMTVLPFCNMCGMSLVTLFEPTGPVDKSLPPVSDVTDVVAAAVRATSKGEFSSVIYDWTCTEKGQPKSLKKCFCVLDFDSQCLRLYGEESIRESKPLLVNLAFDTVIRHTTSDSSSQWIELVVHYNKAPVVECKFSCMDADLANEWVRRIHRCATSVAPMSPVRTAVMRVWGDEDLRKWYLLLNGSDSDAPVELLKFPNNKRQMPMACSFLADKVCIYT